MFENYLATDEDFRAIEEGLRTVWKKELDFVFKDRSLIEKTVVVSFDSQNLYFWSTVNLPNCQKLKSHFKKYKLFKKSHQVKITDKMQKGWQEEIKKELGEEIKSVKLSPHDWAKKPIISGGLLTPFTKIHQKIKEKGVCDPYITYESYLATILHEFAHVYYHNHKLWWFSNKKENLSYLRTAQLIYENKKVYLKRIKIKIPTPIFLSEVFAFCTDYYATSNFWPNHLNDINIANTRRIKNLIASERKKDLDTKDSVLSSKTNHHNTAAVLGILLLHLYPKTWPQKLLKKIFL